MAKDKEREAFKQSVLKMAKYRLRGVLKDAGYSPQEVRAAEVEGEDKMIEMIMTKYDEGAINMPGLEKTGGKSPAGGGEEKEPKRTAKKSPKKKEPEPEEDDDPYSSAFGDDDDDGEDGGGEETGNEDGGDDSGDDGEEPGEETKDDGVENDETEAPPRKAATGRKAKPEAGVDLSALEEKLDKIMDLLVSNVEATVELSEKFDNFLSDNIDFEETVKFAFARIWKLGAANPLKPGFGDVISKAKELAAKRKGSED